MQADATTRLQNYIDALEEVRQEMRKKKEDGMHDIDDRIAPSPDLEPAATYISTAITALFYEQDPARKARFRVRLAPELFEQATNDFFFDDPEEPFDLTLMRIPGSMLDHDPEFRTPYLLSLVCDAYIGQVRLLYPNWNRDVEDPAKRMALDVLDVTPESLAIARKMLWS